MIASQNFCGGTKHPAADDDDIPKKFAKTSQPKKTFFGLSAKTQILLSSQKNKEARFTSLLLPSLNIATSSRIASKESVFFCFCLYLDEVELFELEPTSPISPRCRRKTAPSNQRPSTSKTWEIFGDQELTDYLSSTTNMVKYKNDCQYLYGCLSLIVRGFTIDKFKNIFNVTLSQFLEDDKEYN